MEMSLIQENTNWNICFICQKENKESLRSTDDGRKSLATLLPKFDSKNALDFDINRIKCERERKTYLKPSQDTKQHTIIPAKIDITIVCLIVC